MRSIYSLDECMLKSIFTVPNMLSFLRIILTPVFIAMYVHEGNYQMLAIVLFTCAMLTDTCDGYYARRYGKQTKLGAFLDPIADKILVIATFSLFAWQGLLHWSVVILMALRDVVITSLRLKLVAQGTSLKTSELGKGKTVAQFVSIYLFFLAHWMERVVSTMGVQHFVLISANVVVWIVVLFSLYSGVDYLIKYWRFSIGGDHE